LWMSFDLERREGQRRRRPTNEQLASRIVRKHASILPPDKPLCGDVCSKTVPSTTDARYATLNVTAVITDARTKSHVRCCDLHVG
jgi:hypothetical protein